MCIDVISPHMLLQATYVAQEFNRFRACRDSCVRIGQISCCPLQGHWGWEERVGGRGGGAIEVHNTKMESYDKLVRREGVCLSCGGDGGLG